MPMTSNPRLVAPPITLACDDRATSLIELETALANGVPIVAVSLTTGAHAYDFADANNLLKSLDTELGLRNPGAGAVLTENDVDPSDLSWKLSSTLPGIISIGFNPSASRNVLKGTITDIIEAMKKAQMQEMPAAMPKEEWMRRRKSEPKQEAAEQVASATSEVVDVAAASAPRHHNGASAAAVATIPPEVPSLPDSAVARPDIIDALKARVLQVGTAGANAATVTAPAKQLKRGKSELGLSRNATTATGMGGVGKTMSMAVRLEPVTAAPLSYFPSSGS